MSELPNGWAEVTLGELGQWLGGGTPSKNNPTFWANGEIPWVSPKDMKCSEIIDAEDHITDLALRATSARLVPIDSILIVTRSGILRHSLPVAVARREVAINQDLKALILTSAVSAHFISKQLASRADAILADCAKAGTTVDSIDFERLKRINFFLPPLPEQRRIVAKLDSLDARAKRARADLDRIPTLVARAKQAILAKAFRGELTSDWRRHAADGQHLPNAFHQLQQQREKYRASRRGVRLKELPPLKPSLSGIETWIGCCLADVCELRLGYAFKSDWFSDVGPRLLRGANIATGNIDWTDEKRLSADRAKEYSEYALSAGDMVIAMDRPIISTGIKVARISPEDDGALLVQRVASPICSDHLITDYAWLLLNSELFRSLIARASTGSDLPHISGNDILGMEIPLPSVPEQRQIVSRIETAFTKIDRIAADAASASKLLNRLDQAILAKAFRGELVPQDPNDEPAEELLERIKAERAAPPKPKRTRKTPA
ncbi:MAG: restriction endonuclease subunit S [Methylovirgula sp.]